MRPSLRLILLLVFTLLLRGLAVDAYAMPLPLAAATASHEACEEPGAHAQLSASDHEGTASHDSACRISCDHATASALPAQLALACHALPGVMTPTLPALACGEAQPPDHPPPII